jgi:hypothetical protein
MLHPYILKYLHYLNLKYVGSGIAMRVHARGLFARNPCTTYAHE